MTTGHNFKKGDKVRYTGQYPCYVRTDISKDETYTVREVDGDMCLVDVPSEGAICVNDLELVESDFDNSGTLFSMWFSEEYLKTYVEESEESTPIIPDGEMLVIGDKVKVIGGVWPDLIGKIGEIVAFYEARNTISVLFDFDGEPYEFNYSELEKYEEYGGTVTPNEG